MKTIRLCAAVLSLLIMVTFIDPVSLHAQASMPTGVPLKQSESDHVIYVYEESLECNMADLIKICGDAHSILSPVLN